MMMLSRLSTAFAVSRRVVVVVAARSHHLSRTLSKASTAASSYSSASSSARDNSVPDENSNDDVYYYHGHLMADHLEYLEDMIEKSLQIHESVRIVKESKVAAMESNKRLRAQDVDRLIAHARRQVHDMASQLERLEQVMERNKQILFAVDAPDGESDWHVIEELENVKYLIEHGKK
jgi:hypothetical protein